MKCNQFDAYIDEMLSGVLYPDANQHMRECERCISHFRARATVQHGLRTLAAATASGPSRATDRAVMDSYRRLQQRRTAASGPQSAPVAVASNPRGFGLSSRRFSNRRLASAWTSRTWWSGAAAAAVVFAMVGSGVHLWKGVSAVGEPTIATAPAVPATQQIAAASSVAHSVAGLLSRRIAQRPAQGRSLSAASAATLASLRVNPQRAELTALSTRAALARPEITYEASNFDATPVTRRASDTAAPVMRLASTGEMSNMAQAASSTWPGYSNLMYCDPVSCSGPMQVVHIRVPVGEVKPNLGQTVGNSFVNADVVVGPDGVARAIRVEY